MTPAQLRSAAVVREWRSQHEAHYQDCFHRIDSRTQRNLQQSLSSLTFDPGGGDHSVATARAVLQHHLPPSILAALAAQKTGRARPFVVIDNLPAFDAPARQADKRDTLSENLALGVAALAGEPYSVVYEGDNVVNDVLPKKACADHHTSQGYQVALAFHTEHPVLKHHEKGNLAPNGVVVTGVRADPNGPLTRVSDVPRALKQLPREDRDTLRRPLFDVASPARWQAYDNSIRFQRSRVPLVFEERGEFQVCAAFFPGTVQPRNATAGQALERLEAALKQQATGLAVSPGRLLYINNDRAVHGRDAFDAGFSAEGEGLRWLQRVFVSRDLARQRRGFEPVKPRVLSLAA